MTATNETRENSTQLSDQESRAMTNTLNRTEAAISPEALAELGDGTIAYVKTIRSEDVPALFRGLCLLQTKINR
jgi:hypothetical protein